MPAARPGYFDHVPPPTPPRGTPGEFLSVVPPAANDIDGPVGLGFRVPAFVVSPFSVGGYRSSQVYDHTSTIMLMERIFGVVPADQTLPAQEPGTRPQVPHHD